jgi:hypothetical protein
LKVNALPISDQIKEDEMGGACGMHGRDMILVGRPVGSDHLEDIGVDRLLKWLSNKQCGRM